MTRGVETWLVPIGLIWLGLWQQHVNRDYQHNHHHHHRYFLQMIMTCEEGESYLILIGLMARHWSQGGSVTA